MVTYPCCSRNVLKMAKGFEKNVPGEEIPGKRGSRNGKISSRQVGSKVIGTKMKRDIITDTVWREYIKGISRYYTCNNMIPKDSKNARTW